MAKPDVQDLISAVGQYVRSRRVDAGDAIADPKWAQEKIDDAKRQLQSDLKTLGIADKFDTTFLEE